MENMRSKRRAFTLVELLIVIIVTAVLATMAIPKFADSALRAREARLKMYLRILRDASNRFHADTTLWPKSADLLNGTTPTQGYDDSGNLKNIPPGTYQGPYMNLNNMKIEITGVALGYGTGAPYQVGSWRITGSNRSQDGSLYSTW